MERTGNGGGEGREGRRAEMEERRLDPPWHKLEEQCTGSKVDERNGTDTRGYAKDANNISSVAPERTVKFAGTRPFSISFSLPLPSRSLPIHAHTFYFFLRLVSKFPNFPLLFENFPITCSLSIISEEAGRFSDCRERMGGSKAGRNGKGERWSKDESEGGESGGT